MEAETPLQAKGLVLQSPELAAVYSAHSRAVYYLALRWLGDPTQAEDATHDIFLKAFRHIDQFRAESALRTWLYRIAINHCQNVLRSWHHRHMVTAVDDAVWESPPAPTDNPLRALENKGLGERIQKTLDALPTEYRLILLLAADQELSYDQIASLTDQTTDAVRGKLHRARKAFAAQFAKTA